MYNPDYPFLCMDLTYITCLLKSGYGFEEETVLEVMFWQQHASYDQIDVCIYSFTIARNDWF